ncbi:DUF4371 domain-containing protein [Heracleum sosnowskyi]|uniref:DUF4371 domain-containing protein n=1 Tax=Heracleum sosnowskyi TaxID=360622 RepID=A0AAD8IP62_9APIA|nr:DUF4371 domain-containing protein [Heracleum sosnowskyi]
MNDEIAKAVLENAPKHAMYIAPSIQKEILDIIATKIRNQIRREVRDAKFCILVDESLDISHKEQMAIILRFVDEEGYVRERFFEIVSVKDTTSINLKEQICLVLSTNKLQVQNIREIAESLAGGDLETGKGLNQIRSLKRAGMTRWGSHFASVNNLVHMFKEVTQLLQGMMIDKELAGSIRGDAKVSSTKTLLQALRDDGWANFLQSVQQFVDDHGLEMPNMGAAYSMEAIIDHFESIGDRKAQFRLKFAG